MNQQRSRRFRAAKESKYVIGLLLWKLNYICGPFKFLQIFIFREKLEEIKRLRKMMKDKGYEVPPLKPDSAHFDSNCITPVNIMNYAFLKLY